MLYTRTICGYKTTEIIANDYQNELINYSIADKQLAVDVSGKVVLQFLVEIQYLKKDKVLSEQKIIEVAI